MLETNNEMNHTLFKPYWLSPKGFSKHESPLGVFVKGLSGHNGLSRQPHREWFTTPLLSTSTSGSTNGLIATNM